MTHFIEFIDSLLCNDACVETGMQCAVHVGHVFGF